MEYIDIILAVPLLWGAIIGFKKGFIIEIASLLGLILGIYGAIKFSSLTSGFLANHLSVSEGTLGIISFLLTFLLILFAVFMLGKFVDKLLKIVALGMVNRILGMVFGLLKYAIILSFLIYFYETIGRRFVSAEINLAENSYLYKPISLLREPIIPLLNELELKGDISLELP